MINDNFRKNFEEYLLSKTPVLTDYQFIDDYVEDNMANYKTILRVSGVQYTWLDLAKKRLEYVSIAESANLQYKDKWYKFEIEKVKEQINGI